MMSSNAARQTTARPTTAPVPAWRRNLAMRRRIDREETLRGVAGKILREVLEQCHYGDNRQGCYRSFSAMAREFGVSVQWLRKIIKRLTKHGWICVVRVGPSGSRFTRAVIHLGPRWQSDESAQLETPGPSQLETPGPSQLETPVPPLNPLRGFLVPEKTTTGGPELLLSFAPLTGGGNVGPLPIAQDKEPPLPPAEALGVEHDLVVRVAAMGLKETRHDRQPMSDGRVCDVVDHGIGRFGLRWVAWGIFLAAGRANPRKGFGPVEAWSYILGTLDRWRNGVSLPPAGWPSWAPVTAEAPLPMPKKAPVPEVTEPNDEAELIARIDALEGKKRREVWEETQLKLDREELVRRKKETVPCHEHPRR